MMLALIMAILSTLFIASRGICGRNLLRKINIVKQYSNHHLQSLLTIIPQFPRLYMSTQGGEISPTPPAAVAPLKAKLNEDMKESMKAKQKERLGAIRAVTTAIKQKEVDDRITLTDDDIITIMTKLLKQRKESIISYQAAGRQDLVDIEQGEYDIILTYMPQQLSSEEVDGIIAKAIAAVNATTIKDMGKVMNEVKPLLAGKADMGDVGNRIKKQLGGK